MVGIFAALIVSSFRVRHSTELTLTAFEDRPDTAEKEGGIPLDRLRESADSRGGWRTESVPTAEATLKTARGRLHGLSLIPVCAGSSGRCLEHRIRVADLTLKRMLSGVALVKRDPRLYAAAQMA
jgi:hypothetical protein